MARPKLTLFFDIVSPFAYMAFHILKTSRTFKQCDITYIPIFQGAIMQMCNNTPPIYIKNKGSFIEKDRNRWAKRFNVPFADKAPDGFPPLTLQTQRALCAITLLYPEKLEDCVMALYHAFWVERQPIEKPEVFAPVLAGVLGESKAREVVEKRVSAEAKERLKVNTDLAFKEGCFGIPFFLATNMRGDKDTFWGFDHLGQIIEHLGLEREDEKGFRAML